MVYLWMFLLCISSFSYSFFLSVSGHAVGDDVDDDDDDDDDNGLCVHACVRAYVVCVCVCVRACVRACVRGGVCFYLGVCVSFYLCVCVGGSLFCCCGQRENIDTITLRLHDLRLMPRFFLFLSKRYGSRCTVSKHQME